MRLSTLIAFVWLSGVGLAFVYVLVGALVQRIYVKEESTTPRINIRKVL